VTARSPARLQLKSRLVPILVGLLLLLQVTIPFRGWLILLVVLGGLWLICYLWVRSLSTSLELKREMRYGWTQVGDRLEERFILSNDSYFPALWLEIQDLSNMPGYDTSRGTGVGSKGQSEWRTEGSCTHRGVFTLGPTRIVTGDPFGLYTVSLDIPLSQNLMVLPPIVPLPSIDVAPGGRAGQGRPRRTATERTVSAAGIREYTYGDSQRWIHWPISLHRNALYVRVFESTPASDWWVILDMDQNSQFGAGDHSSVEHGITLAASIVDRGLRAGRSVGFLAHGKEPVWLPPREGDHQRWNILRSMALLTPGDMSLQNLLARMRSTMGQGASLIIITSDLTGRWIDEVLLTMRRGAIPTILLLDNGSLVGANANVAQPAEEYEKVAAISALLTNLGVACYAMPPALFASSEAASGRLGQWNLQVLPTGKVVAIQPPKGESWRSLA
jgi:uncharacterized protein (DUF58 family)